MTSEHWRNISIGDVIQTNHGRGPLLVEQISVGNRGVVTITGRYTDGSGAGKKRVPDNGMVQRISATMGVHVKPTKIIPPKARKPQPPPKPKVRPRGKSAAGLNIKEGRWIA